MTSTAMPLRTIKELSHYKTPKVFKQASQEIPFPNSDNLSRIALGFLSKVSNPSEASSTSDFSTYKAGLSNLRNWLNKLFSREEELAKESQEKDRMRVEKINFLNDEKNPIVIEGLKPVAEGESCKAKVEATKNGYTINFAISANDELASDFNAETITGIEVSMNTGCAKNSFSKINIDFSELSEKNQNAILQKLSS